MKTNLKKVYVEWLDSARGYDWTLLSDVDFKPVECETIGWLIAETDTYITVGQTIGYEPEQVCNTMTIPRCAITRMSPVIRECDLTD